MKTAFHDRDMPWIVCLGGEDWWYHSHAHFDIQVMKRLSRRCRVLYVCSIGMRMPSLRRDAQFWKRISNKLRSVARTLHRVTDRLWVYSPLPLPLYQYNVGRQVNHALLGAQLRGVFNHLGIRRPLFWINTPTGWPIVRGFGHRGVLYQRTDEYAAYAFDNFNAAWVQMLDEQLLLRADLVLHVDSELHERSARAGGRAVLLEQGVDERFLDPPANERPPDDLPMAGGPIVGYVGNLEPHKFNAELVAAAARQLPDCSFVLVGPYHQNADGLRGLPNVHLLGPRPHDRIMAYVRAFDVCMLPTARTSWAQHSNPIKLMEYLAAGRPVVATRTPAADRFCDYVHIADAPEAWVQVIRSIVGGQSPTPLGARARLSRCTWSHQTERIWDELTCRGLLHEAAQR